MAGLFDIAASGIQAYRSALGVTGQNIANLNTEGYRRREASLQEIAATQSDVLTRADQTGLGVRVADISRSFDAFLAGRVRSTAGDDAAAQAFLTAMQELENAMLPGGQDLGSFLNEFFTGLSEVAATPGDLAPRVVALEQGRSLAAAFADTAATFEALRGAVLGQAEQSVAEVNGLLDSLASTQARVLASGQSGAASNAVLDERDRLIDQISRLVGTEVGYNTRNDVTLRLGTQGGGPVLLAGLQASGLAVSAVDGRIAVLTRAGSGLAETQQVTTGRLAGFLEAYAALTTTIEALDGLAVQVAEGLNRLHPNGLTLDGSRGGAVFTADAVTARPDADNVGRVMVTVDAPDVLTDPPEDLDLVYDARAGLWRGLDAEGRVVVSGAEEIRHGAVTLRLAGQAADGDEVALRITTGRAANMRLLLARPEEIAAAGLALASADAENVGAATVTITAQARPTPPPLPAALNTLVPNDGSALSSVRFRADGPVAVIPAGAQAVELASLVRQASVSFALGPTDAASIEGAELSLVVGGENYTFTLSVSSEDSREPVTLTNLAELLNTGAITTEVGKSFADLGLHASVGGSGQITIAAADGSISGTLGSAVGTIEAANPKASDIQIFTREGRQIAGTPLAAADIVRLLTPENGFAPGAEYRAEMINGSGGMGYLGMGVQQTLAQGAYVARFPASGVDDLKLTVGGDAFEVSPAADADAADIAAAINALAPDTGLRAEPMNRVELRLTSDEGLTLALTGANDTPVQLQAAGDLAALMGAVNARTSDTGISATLAPDGTRLVLERAGGGAITLAATSGGVEARQIDERFVPVSEPDTWLSPPQRFDGTLRLLGAGAFNLDANGVEISVAPDPLASGLIELQQRGAGRIQTLSFGLTEGIDTAEAAPDGSAASAAALRYGLSIGAISAEIDSSDLAAQTPADVARALAAALRQGAPVPAMTFDLAETPADGATLTLALGGQTYQLRMQDGVPIITGPEEGRLVATLTQDKKLTVSAPQGALGGHALRLVSGDFGVTESQPERSLTVAALASDTGTFTLRIGDTGHEIALDDGIISGQPDGVGIAFNAGTGPLTITIPADLAVQEVRILPSDSASALGLRVADAELVVGPEGLSVQSLGPEVPVLSATAQSLAPQRIRLTNLPPEDLIVVMTGGAGARQLAARYDIDPATVAATAAGAGAAVVPAPLELRVIDPTTGRVEVFDRTTGHSIATRTLGPDGLIEAAGYRFEVRGAPGAGDRFYLDPNIGATGDGRALAALMALETRDAATGRAGFQDIYRALVTDVGARVASADRAAVSTRALHDAAAEVEAAQSGVNLDTEAARLMEQQQAYQALSRVLGTANDLLDTLLQSI